MKSDEMERPWLKMDREGVVMEGIVNPKVKAYLEAFIDFPELKELEAFVEEEFVPIVHKDTAAFLRFLVMGERPRRILELGSAIGYSALLMAGSYEGAVIDTVDREARMVELARRNVEKFGLDQRIHVHHADCAEFLAASTGTYDFIFIDAGKSHYRMYVDLALPLLSERGVIVCDNVLYRGLVAKETVSRKIRTNVRNLKEFLAWLHAQEELTVSILTQGDGLALIRRKRNA